jgi:hypothetical protein
VLAQRTAVIDAALAELSVPDRAALVRVSERLLPLLAGGQEGERRVCRLCDSEACGRPSGTCPMQVASITSDRS